MSGDGKIIKGKRKRGPRRSATPMDEVPARLRGVLLAYPVRNEPRLKWAANKDGLVTVTHRKNLRRWERWLMKKVGGSPVINRPLDAPGSDIWRLCDGKHTVADICGIMDRRYKEDMEPVLTRVIKFLEMLLERNLISLQRAEAISDGDRRQNRKKVVKGGDGA
jgi:hypothetical protein